MEAARYGEPPPSELSLMWISQGFNSALPDSGGILDQDYTLIMRMQGLNNIYRTITKSRNLVGDQIHSLTASERRIIKWLLDEGYM